MQETSALYRQILDQPDHYKEVQVKIGNTIHPYLSCSVYGSLYEQASVGNTAARQIDLDIYPAGPVNDDDPIQIFVRLSSADGIQKSEWLPQGTFFIDTNPVDHETGVMSIHGFDSMLRMDQPMIPLDEPSGQWPRSTFAVMSEIAARIGVSLHPETVEKLRSPSYDIPYPVSSVLNTRSYSVPLVLNTSTKIIHYSNCSHLANVDASNRQSTSDTIDNLKKQGYSPCKVCRPSDAQESSQSSGDSDPLTMRTVAGYIAAMYGGNWTVTDENFLYLAPLALEVSLLSDENDNAILFGDTLILV